MPEITHVAIIQISGLVGDNATISKAFDSERSALEWVTNQLLRAHGADERITTLESGIVHQRALDDGTLCEWSGVVTFLRTSGGPAWGAVMQA